MPNTSWGTPASEAHVVDAAASGRAAPLSGVVAVRAPRVLVVDDEVLILRTYQRSLRGCRVTTATSLAEVIAAVQSADEPFDVAVVDLALGLESGVDVHRWLRRALGVGSPAVLFLTGGSGTLEDEDYVAAERVRCLIKPIGVAELRSAIADATLARDEPTTLAGGLARWTRARGSADRRASPIEPQRVPSASDWDDRTSVQRERGRHES